MFEREVARKVLEDEGKFEFICPETNCKCGADFCESSCYGKGCKFKNKCKVYNSWKNRT